MEPVFHAALPLVIVCTFVGSSLATGKNCARFMPTGGRDCPRDQLWMLERAIPVGVSCDLSFQHERNGFRHDFWPSLVMTSASKACKKWSFSKIYHVFSLRVQIHCCVMSWVLKKKDVSVKQPRSDVRQP